MNIKKSVLIALFFPITLLAIYTFTSNRNGQEESSTTYYNKKQKEYTTVDIKKPNPDTTYETIGRTNVEEFSHSVEYSTEWYNKELSEYFAAEFCRSIQSHLNIDEYVQERLSLGDDYAEINSDVVKCEGVTVKDWGQLSLSYEAELKLGNQYAELMLAKINPPGFSHGRYWLMQASAWSEEAMNDIDLNFDNVAFDEMQMLFYAKLLNKDDVIYEISKEIDASDYYDIMDLAEKWLTSSPSERKVILNNEILK